MTRGSLHLTGWIADAPDGADAAFLLLSTPGDGDMPAEEAMLDVAAALGLGGAGSMVEAPHLAATVTGDHVTLSYGDIFAERPTVPDWVRVARARGEIVLVVGLDPLPVDASAATIDDYASPARSDRVVLALVPVE